jgi:hypothetical protein
MSTEDAQNLATEQAADRVNKAEWMNQEVATRLHQYDAEPFGVKPAKKVRADGDYPVKGGKVAKVADKP